MPFFSKYFIRQNAVTKTMHSAIPQVSRMIPVNPHRAIESPPAGVCEHFSGLAQKEAPIQKQVSERVSPGQRRNYRKFKYVLLTADYRLLPCTAIDY